MKSLIVYYRISDKGNPKEKLNYADKFYCMENAIKEFGKENFWVIADNCNPETIDYLKEHKIPYEETSLGNCGSFIFMVDKIIGSHKSDDCVYLLEDDYVHLDGSRVLINEALEIGDYVTLYDHPDKYIINHDGGNRFNHKRLKPVTLFVTQGSHWRTVDSTTMTFAVKVSTLKRDYPVWMKYMNGRIPDDFHAFMELTQNELKSALILLTMGRRREFLIVFKNWLLKRGQRTLLSAVPAHSTHAEIKWLSPVVDWKNG